MGDDEPSRTDLGHMAICAKRSTTPAARSARRARRSSRRAGRWPTRAARSPIVHHAAEDAQRDADPARITDAKLQAQATYRSTTADDADGLARRRATVEWMSTIDRINREARRAGQRLARAEHEVRRLSADVARAEQTSDTARIALESALAACAEARQALAAVDGAGEQPSTPNGKPSAVRSSAAQGPAKPNVASADGPRVAPAAASGVNGSGAETEVHRPVLVERMVEGDRESLETAAAEVAHVTGQPASHSILLLHELVEALTKVAVERYYLAFDERHPFWSQFDRSERLAIVASLARLGFRFDPDEGWYGGRTPTVNDLVMALAYAGRDPRMLRGIPTPEEMRGLPATVRVVTLDLLAQHAADLTLPQMLGVLGPRAEGFGELWDDWGRIRPVLLSEADALAA